MVAKEIKIFLKMKNKGWLTIPKIIIKHGKMIRNKRLVQTVLCLSFISVSTCIFFIFCVDIITIRDFNLNSNRKK